MIDLNIKRKQEEEPLGLIILGCLPFVVIFFTILEVML